MATIVQTKVSAAISLSSTPSGVTFDNPTVAGNAIVVCISVSAEPTTIGVSDATNGTYTAQIKHERTGSGDCAAINWFRNAASITSVNVTSSLTGNGVVFLFEVSGLDNSASVLSNGNDDGSTTNHTCAVTGISRTNGFSVCTSQLGGGNGPTVGTGWTELSSPSSARFCQYRTTTISNNVGDYTTSANDNQAGVIASFADAPVVSGTPFFTQVGAKRI